MEKSINTEFYALKACLILILSLGFFSPVSYAASPSSFYGFWETQEEIGDKCIFNIKRGGRASCFFVGSASNEITQGTWEIIDSRLVITWENGHRDALSADTPSSLKREAYNPSSDLSATADYIAQAYRIDPRMPGSLTRSADEVAQESEDDAVPFSIAGPSSKDPAMKAPGGAMRNPFVGYWVVEQSPGLFFGLMTDNTDRFYLFLDRNGRASVSLRKSKSKDDTLGIWEYTEGEARITWPSGRKDIMRKLPNGFQLASLGRKDDFTDKPEDTREARQVSATEANRYFNSGDIRRITMTSLRGLWNATDSSYSNQGTIRILGWGNAELLINGVVKKSGRWEILNDHSVIKWEDESHDILRDEFNRWTRSTYPAGRNLASAPEKRFTVVKSDDTADQDAGSR